jgi:hypothetical protein
MFVASLSSSLLSRLLPHGLQLSQLPTMLISVSFRQTAALWASFLLLLFGKCPGKELGRIQNSVSGFSFLKDQSSVVSMFDAKKQLLSFFFQFFMAEGLSLISVTNQKQSC